MKSCHDDAALYAEFLVHCLRDERNVLDFFKFILRQERLFF